ncbi:hypothetical protein FNT36_05140 [Hymenobacter setariae]|uniref:Glycosyltransferase RgtA/B/C/D-like domain-containing protein n=1 Tax=Hymenobacter setariae TaxID=2594794 RepID=A0A558C3Z1_9BACT|nr:hypothetical protein [Hymenobacter setariae]TVT43474.1 hypothetical protein FNT36_05140 [Hymenobacter setariae]
MLLRYPFSSATLLGTPAPVAAQAPTSSHVLQQRLLLMLLGLGFFFRLFHFFHNRSFFIDELFLNVNVIKFNFWQLATEPFAYEQKAPLGYLWASRLCVVLLGKKEQALRLVSLLSGLGSLVVFVPVARYFLRGWGVVLAVGALALAWPVVYHSVEAKQYSTELFATVLALRLYIKYHRQPTLGAQLAWGLGGALLLWFSFSAIFVLAGMGMAICLPALVQRDWKKLASYVVPCGLWVLSFGALYVLFVSKYHKSEWLTFFFNVKYNAYPPITQPVVALRWLAGKIYDLLDHPLGLRLDVDLVNQSPLIKFGLKLGWVALPVLALGVYRLARQQGQWLLLFLLPLVLALAASAVSQYPFYERFTLFLAPLIFLVLAYGVQQLGHWSLAGVQLRPLVVGLLLAVSLANVTRQAVEVNRFYNQSYFREVMLYLNDHVRPGDGVYVYWNMRPAYDYYHDAYDLKYNAVEGSYVKNKSLSQADYLRNLQPDFATLRGKRRLWHVYDANMFDGIGDIVGQPTWYFAPGRKPGGMLNNYFGTLGKRVEHYHPSLKSTLEATLYELPK